VLHERIQLIQFGHPWLSGHRGRRQLLDVIVEPVGNRLRTGLQDPGDGSQAAAFHIQPQRQPAGFGWVALGGRLGGIGSLALPTAIALAARRIPTGLVLFGRRSAAGTFHAPILVCLSSWTLPEFTVGEGPVDRGASPLIPNLEQRITRFVKHCKTNTRANKGVQTRGLTLEH